ncbi:hypothetical protein [Amycolatopsis mediterranei]|uniref:Uncharacterized protein n=1 Tax=Amycolatopsis mediterranei (strain S699) TaxID=713604 RepID=A0A9R0NWK9_AMYMS|nr:hypothetical protein [Amycolatopsis mediterranei]AEK41963.1 hypothetical protein RAM_17385 [Amycolatopsis mediterranei S699]UZF70426.1 hypothetical protein ISP_003629 [Amycolatopsis mediterranei]
MPEVADSGRRWPRQVRIRRLRPATAQVARRMSKGPGRKASPTTAPRASTVD